MENSTARFSSRVDNYIKCRPSYPEEVIDLLRTECGLDANSTVADIGSGTGILTHLLLGIGSKVFAVEPNKEMRNAAERLHEKAVNFRSVSATAEDTTMNENTVDLIVVGQAFHWFDQEKCKSEFLRILRPGGWTALIWNQRRIGTNAFLMSYEEILREHCTEYTSVNHRNVGRDEIEEFFSPGIVRLNTVQNFQKFDLEGLVGRCLSSSYAPMKGSEKHERMVADLENSFEQYQCDGIVEMEYDTETFYGQIGT